MSFQRLFWETSSCHWKGKMLHNCRKHVQHNFKLTIYVFSFLECYPHSLWCYINLVNLQLAYPCECQHCVCWWLGADRCQSIYRHNVDHSKLICMGSTLEGKIWCQNRCVIWNLIHTYIICDKSQIITKMLRLQVGEDRGGAGVRGSGVGGLLTKNVWWGGGGGADGQEAGAKNKNFGRGYPKKK